MVVHRFEVYLITLDPTVGREIKKTRPCLIVSPNEINHTIGTVIVAPLTSGQQAYPTRVPLRFKGKSGNITLDQIRAIDKTRLIKKMGAIKEAEKKRILEVLQEMFSE